MNKEVPQKKKMLRRVLRAILFLSIPILMPGGRALARELSYDRYTPVFEQRQVPSTTHKVLTGLLTYPLEPLRYAASESAFIVEKHHLDDKFNWVYDKITSYGISPRVGLFSFSSRAVGADVDFVKLAKLRGTFPDLTVLGSIDYANDIYFKTGSKIGLERIADTTFYAGADVNYNYRPQEYFYGIGPATSRGDGAIYSYEETSFGPNVGYRWSDDFKADFRFLYRNVNIGEGHTSGRLQARDLVNPAQLAGSYGDRLLTYQTAFTYDTRNHKGNSDRGGLRSFVLSYNEGLGASEASFMKYQLELSQYLRLGSDRRVLSVRVYGEHNGEVNGGEIPFYEFAKLGGYGRQNYRSDTLRAYGPNRFTDRSAALVNLEYRYNIWQYRDFKLDTVLFWDEGQVFPDVSRFKFGDFRESYGGGFRVSLADLSILSIEIAHGDEGTNFYVRTETPF